MSHKHTHADLNNDEAHNHEHQEWSRRSFLQTLGIGCAGGIMLGGNYLSASTTKSLMMALNGADNDRVLVLIRLQGGNDGLNTIVPLYDFDTYAQARPTLHHRENDLIKLSDDFAIPNFMESLESMWGDGMMKVAHGLGYEDQNKSHFTGSDILASADISQSNEFTKGWLGTYFNGEYGDFIENPPEIPLAIQIGSNGNLVFSYEEQTYAYLVANPEQLQNVAENGVQFRTDNLDLSCKAGQQQSFLRTGANNTYRYAEVIHEAYDKSINVPEYDNNDIANQLAIVARLIKGNLGTKIYMVTHGNYDTHGNQADHHAGLLSSLSNAVKNFYDDLKESGHDKNVLGMTFSEFGRRVTENGSGGTDHGLAAPALLFGSELNGNGFIGEHPDLNDLVNNRDLKYTTDFRSLYSTVLSEWLCVGQTEVENSLNGYFGNVDLGFNCNNSTLSTPTIPDSNFPFTTFIEHTNRETYLNIQSNLTQQVVVSMYDINGRYMGDIVNDLLNQNINYRIHVKTALKTNISSGYYIYKVKTNTNKESFSKKMLLM